MQTDLRRAYLIELVGTFGLVFFSAGVVCINYLAVPLGRPFGSSLNMYQPGLTGVALTQGLILAVLLTITLPISGGYLNPAVTVMLWTMNRLDTRRMSWFLGAQLLGSFLAGLCLRYTFHLDLLQSARFGTPHLNDLAYHEIHQRTLFAGTGVELVLTFFVVLAMFCLARKKALIGSATDQDEALRTGLAAGAAATAATLVGFSLTGAALNPARWFGPAVWEAWLGPASVRGGPFVDVLVFIAGPTLGALLAGLFYFWIYRPALPDKT
ncbi:MAG: aquaporin [Gemmataceae bacterium]|nr:aquaporin [Gemmataceae bacterium]MCI0739741.1 aquaporin [Gemmataceae bacterium]